MLAAISVGNALVATAVAAYLAAITYVAGWYLFSPRDASPHIAGRRYWVARAMWVAALLVTIIPLFPAMPDRYAQLIALHQHPSRTHLEVLRAVGLSGVQHAKLVLSIEAIVTGVFVAVALFIFLLRPHDWVAMLGSAALATYIAWASAPLDTLIASQSLWRFPAAVAQILGVTHTLIFLFVFPDGRLVPRWSWIMLVLWGLWAMTWALFPASPFDLSRLFDMPTVSFTLLMAWWIAGLGAQIRRFKQVANPTHHQQTKWILFASVIVIAAYLVFGLHNEVLAPAHQPSHAGEVFDLFAVPVFMLVALVAPVAFAFSLPRYRLWGIDFVINRVLVYSAIVPILGGLYTASITLSQRLFIALTGKESDAAIVLTTLIVGTAFTSLRDRLHRVANRVLFAAPESLETLQAFNEEVRLFVELSDPDQIMRRALEKAVRALNSGSGAIYLVRRGRAQLAHRLGDWEEVQACMQEWLECDGKRFGWIALGPRRNGGAYTRDEREAFRTTAVLLARAICPNATRGRHSTSSLISGREKSLRMGRRPRPVCANSRSTGRKIPRRSGC